MPKNYEADKIGVNRFSDSAHPYTAHVVAGLSLSRSPPHCAPGPRCLAAGPRDVPRPRQRPSSLRQRAPSTVEHRRVRVRRAIGSRRLTTNAAGWATIFRRSGFSF